MNRFFEKGIHEGSYVLSEDNSRHVSLVLRLRAGDEIIVCDGACREYSCVIDIIGKKSITVHTTGCFDNLNEPSVHTVLYQCMPKTDKMDFIIQKCVELGITEIIPVISDNTVARPDSLSKIDRFNKISEAAAQQSRRGIIPGVGKYMTLKQVADDAKRFDLLVAAYENEKDLFIKEALRGFSGASMALLAGAEGGLSAKEALLLKGSGFKLVSLGKLILRAETAGMFMLSCINYELG